jgi:SAM-dependent methyltransferase
LLRLLLHPLLRDLDPDSPEASAIRAEIVRRKPQLEKIYRSWYASLACALPQKVTGPVLELGCGGGFLREFIDRLIASEVFLVPGANLVLDGQRLPFGDLSLRAIVMLDVLHHIPKVERFLTEAGRCVKPGGVVAMIEPWVTRVSKLVYRYLHQEPFQDGACSWQFPAGGPLSQANVAMPWILFERDLAVFESRFPEWQVAPIELQDGLRYFFTGGVSYRGLLPVPMMNLFERVENRLKPWLPFWAPFARIILTKKRS